jgi:hypothetical protein
MYQPGFAVYITLGAQEKIGDQVKKLITIALLFMVCGDVYAGFTAGNELQEWLSKSEAANESRYDTGIFRGYVSGVVDTGDGVLFCTGNGVTRGQYTAVVSKYIKNNPEKWNKGASYLVIEAMQQAFPCKK